MPFGVLAFRVSWIAAFFLLLTASSPAATQKKFLTAESAFADLGFLSLPFDSPADEGAATAGAQEQQSAPQQAANAKPQAVIERIEFIGNRRIRSDTLKARIFSREGDPYSEETLRRDFQALWNTQFFEDVKLRVVDSPDRPDAKIVIFEVKERPIIRRIRYDGIHSVTESDILDRFK
ncbi:MAG: POTRA domain-containing protein, partial [Candidatus Acidiferrum sp.]